VLCVRPGRLDPSWSGGLFVSGGVRREAGDELGHVVASLGLRLLPPRRDLLVGVPCED
jgi:hypothetical protein